MNEFDSWHAREGILRGAYDVIANLSAKLDADDSEIVVQAFLERALALSQSGQVADALEASLAFAMCADDLDLDDQAQIGDLCSMLLYVQIESQDGELARALFERVLPHIGRNHPSIFEGPLNFNLACYYAISGDVHRMIEHVRRAAFHFSSPEKFHEERCFHPYRNDERFAHAVAGKSFPDGDTFLHGVWWDQLLVPDGS